MRLGPHTGSTTRSRTLWRDKRVARADAGSSPQWRKSRAAGPCVKPGVETLHSAVEPRVAVRQMARPERMITTSEVRSVVLEGELIEDYPEDRRGHSCLIYGEGHGERKIHVVCSPKDEYLAVIAAYLPSEYEWQEDFRTRKTE